MKINRVDRTPHHLVICIAKQVKKYFQLARCTLNIFRIFYISKVLFAHTYNIGRGNEKIHYYLEKKT